MAAGLSRLHNRAKVAFSLHHIKGIYYQNDLSLLLLTLITVVEVMSVKFFHCKIKECHYAQSAVKEV